MDSRDNSLLQFFFTDHFLNYKFFRYIHQIGSIMPLLSFAKRAIMSLLSYARRVLEEGPIHQDRVFPKQTKCSIYRSLASANNLH